MSELQARLEQRRNEIASSPSSVIAFAREQIFLHDRVLHSASGALDRGMPAPASATSSSSLHHRKMGRTRGSTPMRLDSQCYSAPPPLPPTWPLDAEKPPTLSQMEKDMKEWAKAKQDVEASAVHKGRTLEFERVKPIVDELQAELLRVQALHTETMQKLAESESQLAQYRSRVGELVEKAGRQQRLVDTREMEICRLQAKTSALEQQVRAKPSASKPSTGRGEEQLAACDAELAALRAELERERQTTAMLREHGQQWAGGKQGPNDDATEQLQIALRITREELIRTQAARRLLHRDKAMGFQAWTDFVEARCVAFDTLRRAANRLRAPAIAESFYLWVEQVEEARREQDAAAQKARMLELVRMLRMRDEEVTRLKRAQLSPTSKYTKNQRLKRAQEAKRSKEREQALANFAHQGAQSKRKDAVH